MFGVGAHFAHARARRHPSVVGHLFGAKGAVELFDLEKTAESLETAKTFIKNLPRKGRPFFLSRVRPRRVTSFVQLPKKQIFRTLRDAG